MVWEIIMLSKLLQIKILRKWGGVSNCTIVFKIVSE
jgi:hypothetical protein